MSDTSSLNAPAIESLIIRLSAENSHDEHHHLSDQLFSLMDDLNWRSDIYCISDDFTGQFELFSDVIADISEYLQKQKLSSRRVHPFIRLQGRVRENMSDWENLLAAMLPFQQEAYEQQSEVRMLILPIIQVQEETPLEDILAAGEFFRSRLAKPSFYFHAQSSLDPQIVLDNEFRVYVGQAITTTESWLSQLRINHVFDTILERVETGRQALIQPCRRHLVFDEKAVTCFSCFAEWERNRPSPSLELPDNPPCMDCISRSCVSMKPNLVANGKEAEGKQVCMELALAYSKNARHREAADLAQVAFQLSATDQDKSAALLHNGLCHLSLMELSEADEAFKAGASFSNDPGLFAYHRGTAQFARGNYLEAVSLFNKAMAAPSPRIHQDDLLFNLGASLVNLERFVDARACFDRIEQLSAPVRFYQGICDLGEQMTERALRRFKEALALGPAPEDLSRVHFYIGNCLKEVGRYHEAIDVLNEAIDADPTDYTNYNLLGFCLFQTKQYERAIEAFHKAIEVNPGSAIDYASIGSNLRELGRYQDAIAMYHMALSLDPTLTFAEENIAKLKQLLENSA